MMWLMVLMAAQQELPHARADIWFALVLFVASFLVSNLLEPKPQVEDARPSKLGDLKVPRADSGAPIPYVFGRVRMRSPNVIWYGDFNSVANKKKVKTGLFSSKTYISSYTYYVGMDLALCLGPGVILRKIYFEKNVLYSSVGGVTGGTVITLNLPNFFGGPDAGGGVVGDVAFYNGDFTQTVDPYLILKVNPKIPAYNGICHLVLRSVSIGTAPALKTMSFEIERYPNNLGLGASRIIGFDLNPMEILYSCLTEEWGGQNLSASDIDTASFTAAAATLLAEANGMSMTISSANDAKEVISEILRQVDGIMYQDPTTGKTKVALIRNDYSIPALPLFDASNVKEVTDWGRTAWSETVNQVRAGFSDRSRNYETSTAFAQDMANIAFQGNHIHSISISFPGCTEGTLAVKLAQRELSQSSVPLFRATIVANRQASTLRPGSVFRLTWPEFNLVEVIMRVQSFDLGELIAGRIVMNVLQDKFSAANALFSSPETTLWQPVDHSAPTITEFNVFETPYYFVTHTDSLPSIPADSSWLAGFARPPAGSAVNRYDMMVSKDSFVSDTTVELNQAPFTRSAKLVNKVIFVQGQRAGLITKITIQLPYPSNAGFGNVIPSVIRNEGFNLFVMNGEIMAYETSTNLGSGVFELNNVHRALFDTQYQTHPVGSTMFMFDFLDWFSLNARPDTQALEYRILSYTDRDAQDISAVVSGTLTNNQRYDRPLAPDELLTVAVRCPQEILETSSILVAVTTRNRINPNTVVFVDDTLNAPEAGTTYNVRFLLDGVQLVQNSGVAVPSTLVGLAGVGIGRIEVEAIRAGLISFLPDFVEFWYGNYPSLTAELLTNPNFEGVLTGWTTISGTWATETTVFPLDAFRSIPNYTANTRHARATGTNNELRQDFTIGANSGRAALISAWKGGKTIATGQLVVELRDASSALQTITTPLVAASDVGKWDRLEIPLPLRTDATIVRVKLIAPVAESVWDNVSLRANTVTLTSAGFFFDTVTGVTPVGAWGLRKMISGYAGNLIRIRDTFDDTEQDVGFDPDGNLKPYFVRGTARVVRLYDQTGNGAHLDAAVADQPKLVAMFTETGRPGIKFDNNSNLIDVGPASTSRPYMALRPNAAMAVGPRAAGAAAVGAMIHIPQSDTTHTTPFFRWGMTTGDSGTPNWRYQVNGAQTSTAGNQANNSGKNVWFWDYQNGNMYHNNDAVAISTFTAADITYPNVSRLRIGRVPPGANQYWDGIFYELCIFTGNIAALDRKTIHEAQADYWYNLVV